MMKKWLGAGRLCGCVLWVLIVAASLSTDLFALVVDPANPGEGENWESEAWGQMGGGWRQEVLKRHKTMHVRPYTSNDPGAKLMAGKYTCRLKRRDSFGTSDLAVVRIYSLHEPNVQLETNPKPAEIWMNAGNVIYGQFTIAWAELTGAAFGEYPWKFNFVQLYTAVLLDGHMEPAWMPDFVLDIAPAATEGDPPHYAHYPTQSVVNPWRPDLGIFMLDGPGIPNPPYPPASIPGKAIYKGNYATWLWAMRAKPGVPPPPPERRLTGLFKWGFTTRITVQPIAGGGWIVFYNSIKVEDFIWQGFNPQSPEYQRYHQLLQTNNWWQDSEGTSMYLPHD